MWYIVGVNSQARMEIKPKLLLVDGYFTLFCTGEAKKLCKFLKFARTDDRFLWINGSIKAALDYFMGLSSSSSCKKFFLTFCRISHPATSPFYILTPSFIFVRISTSAMILS